MQVAHGTLYIIISANLSLYLAGGEEGRVLVKYEAEDGSLSAGVLSDTLIVHWS